MRNLKTFKARNTKKGKFISDLGTRLYCLFFMMPTNIHQQKKSSRASQTETTNKYKAIRFRSENASSKIIKLGKAPILTPHLFFSIE